MGLRTSTLGFIESSIKQVFGKDTIGLHMLELGDQVIKSPGVTEKTGKDYFTNCGYTHTSVDINGLHGAVVRDLTKPEQFYDWYGLYDVLTNSGTTEHVEPFEAQYTCFNILHNCLKVGGMAVHMVPDVHAHDEHSAWRNHCGYYYSKSFFDMLADECEYELFANTEIKGLRCAAIRKAKDKPFMYDSVKFLSLIAQRDY